MLKSIKRLTATSLVGFTLFFPEQLGKAEEQANDLPIIINYSYPSYFQPEDESIFYEEMYSKIDNLPDCIEQIIIESGVKIVIVGVEGKLENMFGYSSIKGIFTPKTNTIYVEGLVRDNVLENYRKKGVDGELLKDLNDYSLSQKISLDTLFHEIGHIVDKFFGNVSKTNTFRKIYNEEKSSYKKTTEFRLENRKVEANIKTDQEYFASAFACYILYPEDLKEYANQTYNYINKLIEEYEKNNKIESSNRTLIKKY